MVGPTLTVDGMGTPRHLVVFGAGRIGSAVARRLLEAGHPHDRVTVTTRDGRPTARTGGLRTTRNAEAAALAEVALICAKPQDTAALVDEIGPALDPDVLVVSFASGLPTAFFEDRLPGAAAVVRVMTTLAIELGCGSSVISRGRHATDAQAQYVLDLLAPTGTVVEAPEDQLDAVSAVAGAGLAYVYFLVEAMTHAGVAAGLPGELARDLLVQSVVGAGELLRISDRHPVQLREDVMSRGGQTIAGFRELERHNVRTALFDAVIASRDRGIELGAQLAGGSEVPARADA